MLKKKFIPDPKSNRMRYAGDLAHARKILTEAPPANLLFLLKNRFCWMNDFIEATDTGIEVGCGLGVSSCYIKAQSFLLTDFNGMEWLDVKHVNALETPFPDESFNFVVSSNMIHHLPYPLRFFREMHRILKKNGVLLIQEINLSLLCRALAHIMRSEGYCYEIDIFDINFKCAPDDDYWAGNNSIPNLLFDDKERFEKNIPGFTIIKRKFSEVFTFINSGGVTAKTFFVPLPLCVLKCLKIIDDFLAKRFPMIFALQQQIVLRKT